MYIDCSKLYIDTFRCVYLTLTIVKLNFLELPNHIYITILVMRTEAPYGSKIVLVGKFEL